MNFFVFFEQRYKDWNVYFTLSTNNLTLKLNSIYLALKFVRNCYSRCLQGSTYYICFISFFLFAYRNTRWNFSCSSSGTIHDCVTVTDHVTNFWTQSTTTTTFGSQTRTSSCTETSRIPSYRSTLLCGSIAMALSTIWCGTNTI